MAKNIKEPIADDAQDAVTTNINAQKKAEDPMVVAAREVARANKARKDLIKHYRDEEHVTTYLAPLYRPHFGNVMVISVNGIRISFPIDGSKQDIPITYADEIDRRRRCVDAITTKQNRMADVRNNYESNPGELKLY